MIERLKRSLWVFDIGLREMQADGAPGWSAPMAIFSAMAVILIAGAAIGRAAAECLLTMVGIVDLLVTRHFARWSLQRIRRLGTAGPSRARWWIEVAALDCMLCMSVGIFAITHGRIAGLLPAWLQLHFTVVKQIVSCLFVGFVVLALTGFVLGLVRDVRIRGRSLELVSFFFWMFVGIQVSFLLPLPDDPALGTWVAVIFLIIAVAAACLAAVIGAARWLSGSQRTTPISMRLGS